MNETYNMLRRQEHEHTPSAVVRRVGAGLQEVHADFAPGHFLLLSHGLAEIETVDTYPGGVILYVKGGGRCDVRWSMEVIGLPRPNFSPLYGNAMLTPR